MPFKNLVQDLEDFKRFEEIIHVLFKHGLGYIIEKIKYDYILKKFRKKKGKKKAKLDPKKARYIFQELGGTFIKLGQLLSLGPDLIPKEYCDEFSKLQDDVEPFSGEEAENIIQEEIGSNKRIAYIKKRPIAAASIGQVHEAVLRNNERIVIKVQRPDVKNKMMLDIKLMYKLARLIEKNYNIEFVNPTDIVQEFERYTKDELDYIKEAENCSLIHNNFKKDKNVIIPKSYLDLTTKKVLTLEYIEGKKLIDIRNKKIANILANAIFKQVFADGIFHADPHPGNILILSNNKIAFLDFGIVGRLDSDLKKKIKNLFIAVIDADTDSMTESLLDLGIVGNINKDSLKEDLKRELGKYYRAKLNEIKFIEVFDRLINLARTYNITLPKDFVLLGKCIMTTESVCCSLDPEFDLVKAAHPFIKRLIKEETKPEAVFKNIKSNFNRFKNFFLRIPEEEREILYEIKDVDNKIKEVEEDIKGLTKEIEKTGNRKIIGYIIAALIIAGSIVLNYNKSLSIYLFISSLLLFVIFIISMLKDKY